MRTVLSEGPDATRCPVPLQATLVTFEDLRAFAALNFTNPDELWLSPIPTRVPFGDDAMDRSTLLRRST
jgi:hypothetical protein